MGTRALEAARSIPPSAARLTRSLRDIGYDFPAAVADLVDNSLAAQASRIDIDLVFDGADSWVSIRDDGRGMTERGLLEALRFGTRRNYEVGQLGRYGLGLKTAPLSQCRRITVYSRHSPINRTINSLTLDLDVIDRYDDWIVFEDHGSTGGEASESARESLSRGPGTVVIWEKLDRVFEETNPEGAWARRRLEALARRTVEYLSMVFGRFLVARPGRTPVVIAVNGQDVAPWDPFAQDESKTEILATEEFEVAGREGSGVVRFSGYVLPTRDEFTSPAAFERLSGPKKWNRQQGLYVYRADRLVQWGGWSGLRAIDEHTKLARASVDFSTNLDDLFHINVAKMRVTLPPSLRPMIQRPVHEMCARADARYRRSRSWTGAPSESPRTPNRGSSEAQSAGLALKAAAMELGHYEGLKEIASLIRHRDPHMAAYLGLG